MPGALCAAPPALLACGVTRCLVCLPAWCWCRSLYESLVCNEYVNDLPSGGPSLLPEDAAQRARARLIIDQVGGWLGSEVRCWLQHQQHAHGNQGKGDGCRSSLRTACLHTHKQSGKPADPVPSVCLVDAATLTAHTWYVEAPLTLLPCPACHACSGTHHGQPHSLAPRSAGRLAR